MKGQQQIRYLAVTPKRDAIIARLSWSRQRPNRSHRDGGHGRDEIGILGFT